MNVKTELKNLSTSAGFLEEATIEFAPGLTCVIGARGTCKSTLIESIRFAFEQDERTTATLIGEGSGDQRAPTHGIIRETLRAGSVRCELATTHGDDVTNYTLEREVGGDPRLFAEGVREHTNRAVLL